MLGKTVCQLSQVQNTLVILQLYGDPWSDFLRGKKTAIFSLPGAH